MFAKSRGSSTAPCDLLPDPIRNTYEIGKQSATAGPENVWRIYDGYRKKDRMAYKVEECADTLAFASEPVLASLANVLAYKEQLANTLAAQSSGPMGKQNHPPTTSHHRSTFVKEYELHELEVKYGLLQLDDHVAVLLPLVPIPLREAVTRLLHKDPEQRPTAQILTMIKFFRDPFVHALQFLDVSKMKDVSQKEHFYTTTLRELLPYMPKKLWYQHIWTYLHAELQTQEVLSAVLQPMLYIVQNCTKEEYDQIVFPTLKYGTVTLLENLHVILEKTPQEYEREVLSMLYMSFENSTIQVRMAAFVAVAHVTNYLEDDAIRNVVLPKLLDAFENNSADARVLMDVVPCILCRLEKQKIIDCILPLLCKVKLQEPEIVVRVVNIYRLMLTDKKYGLSVNWMAAHAMPSLLPQTVNPALNLEQFILLLEVLQDMLNNIERQAQLRH
ncbi:scy1-like protein 2 protein [Lasius niger]|uniref:Scy1-like protein 2 protein n=1 Tax=Lasius niger TaxID=67767 RepID=A0A0J7KSF8_LASNI|nr:scy1-like protein 2 protein [Lasius niger]